TTATLFPNKPPAPSITDVLRPDTVRVLAIPATSEVAVTNEIIIQDPAMIRPALVAGALSPYPTVVMVTTASHIPFPIPFKGSGGNSFGFLFLSANQSSVPTMVRIRIKIETATKNPLLKKGLIRFHIDRG